MMGVNLNWHPMSKITDEFFDAVIDLGGTVIVALDEIDNIGTSDGILYSIPRAKSNGNIVISRSFYSFAYHICRNQQIAASSTNLACKDFQALL
jgi:Cdc6-like AAA superfamily ATPase